jgi:glycosyltransferase involved in cell wall biosynthesis
MNYGCCCVTSDISECADVMGGCGFTFTRGNVKELQETLQDLCDHPNKVEEHRGEARKMISSKYTWQDITAQTDELYRSLLDG